MRCDLIAAHGRVTKLSFFIHDFMGACQLEKERIDACIFMVATAEGPLSMCLHNAKRDSLVLKPIRTPTADGEQFWNPVTGLLQSDPRSGALPPLPLRRRKGRDRPARSSDVKSGR
jgi:hypothetical protein